MNTYKNIPLWYLRVVSGLYIGFGAIGLLRYLGPDFNFMLSLALLLSAPFLIVIPLPLIEQIGDPLFQIPRTAAPEALARAEWSIGILCALGFLGGLISFWATREITRQHRRGYWIWLFFVLLSFGVSILNYFTTLFPKEYYLNHISLFWAATYLIALILTYYFRPKPTDNPPVAPPEADKNHDWKTLSST